MHQSWIYKNGLLLGGDTQIPNQNRPNFGGEQNLLLADLETWKKIDEQKRHRDSMIHDIIVLLISNLFILYIHLSYPCIQAPRKKNENKKWKNTLKKRSTS